VGCYNRDVIADVEPYLVKARTSLAGAHSELEQRRFDNAANRAYFACFQAAITALVRAGVRPMGRPSSWEHAFVQSRFVGDLINRRKLYPGQLRDTLALTISLRHKADYQADPVTATQAIRAVNRAARFVEAVDAGGGTES
jgi:uncharacterized protein (UPF0332 family)